MRRIVDLQTQSRKHFGRTTYDLNGQIKAFSSPSKLVLQKVDAALVNFRGICSRANLKKMPFIFWDMNIMSSRKMWTNCQRFCGDFLGHCFKATRTSPPKWGPALGSLTSSTTVMTRLQINLQCLQSTIPRYARIFQDIPSNQRIQSNHSSLPQARWCATSCVPACFLQITQPGKTSGKKTRLFLHRLTFSCAFKRLLFVLLSSNSGLCEAPLGTLPWMPAMDVPVLMLP